MKNYVAPSLLAANKDKLLEEIKLAEDSGAEFLHYDVMDGKFVENVSFSLEEFKQIAKKHKMINDVHVMISDPDVQAIEYAKAGAGIVTFHLEAFTCPSCMSKVINEIHKHNTKVGISIKPNTPVRYLVPFLKVIDLVLIMSVEPGKGGQAFIKSALKKIKFLRKYINKHQLDVLIEVDGGINDITGPLARKAGADILVAGSYLFGHDDFKKRLEKLR
ncbi:MAG: ribulose-phosphate 3-epimerase [Bacilli bacterium]|jgi:ribulose-phosphate 3-epimerase|nr:ribulose-phosphate 3-epimerase [Bacilli bacterium]NLN80594.1 ribulose-phosphate 3-epimerase [Erysipelotrichia bacterium]